MSLFRDPQQEDTLIHHIYRAKNARKFLSLDKCLIQTTNKSYEGKGRN